MKILHFILFMLLIILMATWSFSADTVNDYAEDLGVGTYTGNLSTCSDTDIEQCLVVLDNMTMGHSDGANCSTGYAPEGVDGNGAVQACFDVMTQAEHDALDTDNLPEGSTNLYYTEQRVKHLMLLLD